MSDSNKVANVTAKLHEIATFLSANGANDWASGFERLANEYPGDPDETRVKIKRYYGGMGSFNDLVLHKNRVPLRKENNELKRLRRELWHLIHDFKGPAH